MFKICTTKNLSPHVFPTFRNMSRFNLQSISNEKQTTSCVRFPLSAYSWAHHTQGISEAVKYYLSKPVATVNDKN